MKEAQSSNDSEKIHFFITSILEEVYLAFRVNMMKVLRYFMDALGKEKSTIPLGFPSPLWEVLAHEVLDFIHPLFDPDRMGKTTRFNHLF